jgi:hypothetical protein
MNIKTIRFDRNFYDTTCGTAEAYDCSEQGDLSGEYVKAEDVRELMEALRMAEECIIDLSPYPPEGAAGVIAIAEVIHAIIAKHTKGTAP